MPGGELGCLRAASRSAGWLLLVEVLWLVLALCNPMKAIQFLARAGCAKCGKAKSGNGASVPGLVPYTAWRHVYYGW